MFLNKIIKKSITIVVLGMLGTVVLAESSLAASVIFSPSEINMTPGQSFDVLVKIDPEGVDSYTTKIQVQYPTDILEVESFTFNYDWLALSLPGFDSTNNASGLLIKTAGYPGGFSDPVIFGTISFSTKRAGGGIIEATGDSYVFDAIAKNVLAGPLAQTVVAVTVPEEGIISFPEPEEAAPDTETILESTTPNTRIVPEIPERRVAPNTRIVPEIPERRVAPNTRIVPERRVAPRREIVPEEKVPLFDIRLESSRKNKSANMKKITTIAGIITATLMMTYTIYTRGRRWNISKKESIK